MPDSVAFRQLSVISEVCRLCAPGTCPMAMTSVTTKELLKKIKCSNCLLSFQWKTSLTVNLPYFEILSSGKAMVTHQVALDKQGVFLRPS